MGHLVEFLDDCLRSYRQFSRAGLHRFAEIAVKDLSAPLRVGLLRQLRVDCGEHLAHIAGDCSVHLDVLVELGGVDVDMYYLSLFSENGGISGHAVGEACADADE